MNLWKLTAGNLTAGCCGPIKLSNECTMLAVIEPPGSYLFEGGTQMENCK